MYKRTNIFLITIISLSFASHGCYKDIKPAVIAVDRHGNPPGIEGHSTMIGAVACPPG